LAANQDRLITALDVDTCDAAGALVDALSPHVAWFKVGSQLFTREGPRVCELVKNAGAKLFLDLKYHDIPNTVAGAVRSAMTLEADMLTLHSSGGERMLSAAREAVEQSGRSGVILLAVTVLTHLDVDDLGALFASGNTHEEMVLSLAATAKRAGMTGVVASARELRLIKESLGKEFTVVTPGIRLPDTDKPDDQVRVVTPERAVSDGADFIVVGRPIIAAPDPASACREILTRMAGARRQS
jgi:orotidine-5'-phosphate decarboxylase